MKAPLIKAGKQYATPDIPVFSPTITKPVLKLLRENSWVSRHEIFVATGNDVDVVVEKIRKEHLLKLVEKDGVSGYSLVIPDEEFVDLIPGEIEMFGG